MIHWKSYLASFLVLTIGLLWLFAATGPTQQKADAGILQRMRENRQARREARWERIQEWHRQHDGDGKHRPQPQPQPQPVPVPTPPAPVVPPAPINPPKPPTPDPTAPIKAGSLWLIEVPPSLMAVDSNLEPVLFSANVLATLQAKGNHRVVVDQATAAAQLAPIVQRAIADGLPRAILLDTTQTADKWIVGSLPLTSEADILNHLQAYQGK